MGVEVSVLRVFTDASGCFGNPLGVVDAATVAPADRQRVATELGYSETIFVDLPEPGSPTAGAHIFTPATELPFAGHPTVGAGWWLHEQGTPVHTLEVPAGIVQISQDGGLTSVRARADWSPQFTIHDLAVGGHVNPHGWRSRNSPWWDAAGSEGSRAAIGVR